MRRNSFIVLFITVNIAIIFLIIYKQNIFIKYSFQRQKYEKELEDLTTKKESLVQELYKMQNPAHVKDYARKNLNMSDVSIKRIQKVKPEDVKDKA